LIRGILPGIDIEIKGKLIRQSRFINLLWAISALLILALILFSYYIGPKSLTKDEKEISTQIGQGVVKVVSPNREWRGTGFFIAPDKVMTNTHVVKNLKEVDIFSHKLNQPIRGRVVMSFYEEMSNRLQNKDPLSWEYDFAIIEIPTQQAHLVIPLGDSRYLKSGTGMLIIGYHGGLDESVSEPQWTKGYLLELGSGESSSPMRLRVTANPGSSGSPVISIEKKNVVGLVFGGPADKTSKGTITYAIPIERIRKIASEKAGIALP
jgi:S1-C subfamily serine protease